MLNPANIIRSKRKTLALYIDPMGQLIVKAPTKLSNEKIFAFIKSKEAWIKRRQAQATQNSYINKSVLTYQSFYFLGQELTPIISSGAKQITKSDNALIIPEKFVALGQDKTLRKIKKWLETSAKSIIEQRADYFSQRLKLPKGQFSINNNKTRWGTCDKQGNITLNWRAVMLPANLLDYIVVHEFCHILEFNHSKQFWQIVETILPDWRVTRRHLKQMNWILTLFR